MFRVLLSLARRSATPWDEALLERVVAPTRLATAVALFYAGALALRLPDQGNAMISEICKVLVVASMAWTLARAVDLFSAHIESGLTARGDTATVTLVPLGRRVTKVFIYTLAGLSLLQNLGFSIGGLLAGLGIGGLAIALAAQKTLENLFGGFVLVADRPVSRERVRQIEVRAFENPRQAIRDAQMEADVEGQGGKSGMQGLAESSR